MTVFKINSNSSSTFTISKVEYKWGYISPFEAFSQTKCSKFNVCTFNKIKFSFLS